MKLLFLKTIYKALLTSLPTLTYNSLTKNFFAPFQIQPYSTYINFKLEPPQVAYLKNYLSNYKGNLELHPIRLSLLDIPAYYMSVNIYNCTSPLFITRQNITRCEINTYVRDQYNNFGTLILDYCSNSLSLDPVEFFKSSQYARFWHEDKAIKYHIKNDKINFSMTIPNLETPLRYKISDSLIQFTDNIYYKNGICDKLYYDSSLVKAILKIPQKYENFWFSYKSLQFHKIHSIFYFQYPIQFICGIWHNLYNKIYTIDNIYNE